MPATTATSTGPEPTTTGNVDSTTGNVDSTTTAPPGDTSSGSSGTDTDGPPDPFGEPVRIDELSDVAASDDDPSLTGDLLELYFASTRDGDEDIFVSTRASVMDPWSPAVRDAILSSNRADNTPEVHVDGLILLMSRVRSGGAGDFEIFYSVRATRADPWSAPVKATELSTADQDLGAMLTPDLAQVYLASDRVGTEGSLDLWVADVVEVWPTPSIGPVNRVVELSTAASDGTMTLGDDRRVIYFESNRGGTNDLWRAERADAFAPFGEPVLVEELSLDDASDIDPWISLDGRTMVFASDRDGSLDLYWAER